MGVEGSGIRRLTADLCDQLIQIPMDGTVECLNVSVATGVCLFEAKDSTFKLVSLQDFLSLADTCIDCCLLEMYFAHETLNKAVLRMNYAK